MPQNCCLEQLTGHPSSELLTLSGSSRHLTSGHASLKTLSGSQDSCRVERAPSRELHTFGREEFLSPSKPHIDSSAVDTTLPVIWRATLPMRRPPHVQNSSINLESGMLTRILGQQTNPNSTTTSYFDSFRTPHPLTHNRLDGSHRGTCGAFCASSQTGNLEVHA